MNLDDIGLPYVIWKYKRKERDTMKVISEASKEQIITMCGSNQHSHHPPIILPEETDTPFSNQKKEEIKKEEKAS